MRSLNLAPLRAFVEVVERGSFTAAAKELNLTQPAVTHQVQELERRFKVALVERFGKRAYLTQAGEKLIEHARKLLEEDTRTQRGFGRMPLRTSSSIVDSAQSSSRARLALDGYAGGRSSDIVRNGPYFAGVRFGRV
jgi:DNA-binding transcriptional LysR family regulator